MTTPEIPSALIEALAAERKRLLAQGVAWPALSWRATQRWAEEFGVSPATVERAALTARLGPERYRRNLGTVGFEGQRQLLEATVAIVGAGGLGGWIIEGLARMGVGRLIVVDGDRFEENNLNRQLGCTEAALGRPKAQVLAERVAQVNSAVEVSAHHAWLTLENAPTLLAGAQVVVDALDSLPARYLLQEAAARLGVPMVHGAIAGFTGQVMTIWPGEEGLRALYGPQPPSERGVEVSLGNPAATPMMIAAWEIQEAVKLITGAGRPLRRRLLLLDAENGEATELTLD